MFYDVEFAKINAKYQEEKLTRQMQDGQADIDFVLNLFQKIGTALNGWLRPTVGKSTNQPIGDIQTNLG